MLSTALFGIILNLNLSSLFRVVTGKKGNSVVEIVKYDLNDQMIKIELEPRDICDERKAVKIRKRRAYFVSAFFGNNDVIIITTDNCGYSW